MHRAEPIRGDGVSTVHVRYARKLPHKAARLSALVMMLRGIEPEAGLLDRARREAHQLKGTAAAYGFAAVSSIAARIEERLAVGTAGVDWMVVSGLVDELVLAAKVQCESALISPGGDIASPHA